MKMQRQSKRQRYGVRFRMSILTCSGIEHAPFYWSQEGGQRRSSSADRVCRQEDAWAWIPVTLYFFLHKIKPVSGCIKDQWSAGHRSWRRRRREHTQRSRMKRSGSESGGIETWGCWDRGRGEAIYNFVMLCLFPPPPSSLPEVSSIFSLLKFLLGRAFHSRIERLYCTDCKDPWGKVGICHIKKMTWVDKRKEDGKRRWGVKRWEASAAVTNVHSLIPLTVFWSDVKKRFHFDNFKPALALKFNLKGETDVYYNG